MSLFFVLVVLSGTAFLVYGTLCLFSERMVHEFERYGLARFRTLTGALEVLGGTGLLIGLLVSLPLLCFAAGGLAVLMLLGVGVRIRMRDGVLLTLPAFVLLCVNGYLAWQAWVRLTP